MGLFEDLKADEAVARGVKPAPINMLDQLMHGVQQKPQAPSLRDDLRMQEFQAKRDAAAEAADAENSTWDQDELIESILAEKGAAGLREYGKASSQATQQAANMKAWEKTNPVLASVQPMNVDDLQQRQEAADALASQISAEAQAKYDRQAANLEGTSRSGTDLIKDLANTYLQIGSSTLNELGNITGIDTLREIGREGGKLVRDMLASERTKEATKLSELAQSDPGLALRFNMEHPGEALNLSAPSAVSSLGLIAGGGRLPLAVVEKGIGRKLAPAIARKVTDLGVAGTNSWINGSATAHDIYEQTGDPVAALKGFIASAAMSAGANKVTEGGAAGSVARAGLGDKVGMKEAVKNIAAGTIKEPVQEWGENRGDFYGKKAAGLDPSRAELEAQDVHSVLPAAVMGTHSSVAENLANRANASRVPEVTPQEIREVVDAIVGNNPQARSAVGEALAAAVNPQTPPAPPAPPTAPGPAQKPAPAQGEDDGAKLAAAIEALGNRNKPAEQTQVPAQEPAPALVQKQEQPQSPAAEQTPAAQQQQQAREAVAQAIAQAEKPQERGSTDTLLLQPQENQAAPADKYNDIPNLPKRVDKNVLQNRKRDQQSSVAQMRTIANNPDYARTGYSRDFGNGAPVVAFGNIPAEQRGADSYAVTPNGERIPVQYAVVEADEISASNDITGAENPDYGLTDRVTAVAGNGRVVGLAEAYRTGRALTYRQEMTDDSSMHGVNPAVIKRMKHPVLVRVMPNSRVRPGIADESNTSGNQQLNAVEQAQNDAGRVDLDSLTFNDDGTPSAQAVDNFVRAMPASERAGMVDAQGRAAVQAVDRLNNAIFSKAYKNDSLAAMYSQATDPEAKLVLGALARLAPKMAKLDGAGDLDFRNALTDAVNAIVQGKRKGLSMKEIAQQVDAFSDPDTQLFIELFARNPRSTKEAVRILSDAADFVYSQMQEAQNPTGDMFGNAVQATRRDVINRIRGEYEQGSQQQRTGRQAAPQNAQGSVNPQEDASGRVSGGDQVANDAGRTGGDQNVTAEREGSGREGEDFSLTGQTEEEAQAEETRIRGIQEEEERANREAEEEERKEKEARDGRNAADRAVDDFALGDDTVTPESAVMGQGQLKFSKAEGSSEFTPDSDLIDRAVENFGTTTNPREAGYILPDGRMLDFSGRHWGLSDREARGRRSVDHRDVSEAMDDDFDDVSEFMYQFMGRTGAVRVDVGSGVASASRPLTPAQARILGTAFRGDDISLSYTTPEGRIVTDADIESASPRKIAAFFEDAQAMAERGEINGALASRTKNGGNTETAASVRESARRDLGDSVDQLEKSGLMTIVESEEDLPENIRKRLQEDQDETKGSRAAKLDKQRRYENGLKKLAEALRNRTAAHHFVYNDDLGAWLDFDWGRFGIFVNENFDTEHAFGISHSIDKRSIADYLSPEEVANLLKTMVRVLVNGKLIRRGDSLSIQHERFIVRIARAKNKITKKEAGNHFVITGYGSIKRATEGKSSASPDNPGLLPITLKSRRTQTDGDRNRNISAIADIIIENDLLFKRSADGKIQGVYDPRTGKSYIIAGNIPKGNATGVILHEIGDHMAGDPRHKMNMGPVFKRGLQLVNVGAANGDPTCVAVKKRLEDAGENLNDAEEASAYLVEEIQNRKEKVSSPIKRWWENLKSIINGWLIRHGFKDISKLSADDMVDLAKANIRALARASKNQTPAAPSAQQAFAISRSMGKGASPDVPPPVAGRLRSPRTPWNAIVGRDELGNTRFEAGARVYEVLSNGMYKIFDFIDEKANRRFNLGLMKPELRKLMRQFKADKDNIMRNLEPIVREMSTWSEDERKMVSDIIEKQLATNVIPPARVARVAGAIRNLMDSQTDELVRLGGISQETADRWRGQYLPRIYMRSADQIQRSVFEDFFGRNKPIESVTGKHLKARGIFDTMTTEHEIADAVALGWEVRDQNWEWKDGRLNWIGSPEQKELFADRPEELIAEGVTVWRDYTPEERASMGEVRDALSRFVLGFMSTQRDIAVMQLYDQLSKDRRFSHIAPAEGLIHVPDTTIEGTGGVKKYGALANMYVTPEVWSQLENQTRVVSSFGKAYKKLLAGWKEGKTALNPVAHFNNTVSNLTMAHFAGVSYWDVHKYVATACEFIKGEEKSDMIKEAFKYGLFSGSFTKEEMASLVPDATLREVLDSSEGRLDKAIDLVNGVLSWGLRSKLRNAYEFEDSFFKLVIYMDARKHGMSPEDAVDHATRYIFTYDDLPSGAAFIRDMPVMGIPFFAWTYKAIPCLARTMFEHPLRFAAPGAVLMSLNMMTYWLMAGAAPDDDDYWDRMQRAWKQYRYESNTLPDYMKGSVFAPPKALRLWNDSLTGFAQFLDTSRIVPGVDFLDFDNQMGGVGVPQSMMPSSPLFSLTLALISNKDSFTGTEIVNAKSDTAAEAWQKRGMYLAKNLSPSLAPWSYHGARIANAISYETGAGFLKDSPGAKEVHDFLADYLNTTGYTGNHVPMTLARAAEHTTGIKNRLVDFNRQEEMQRIGASSTIKQIQSDLRSKARQLRRGTISQAYFDREREKAIEKIKLVRQREEERQVEFPKP